MIRCLLCFCCLLFVAFRVLFVVCWLFCVVVDVCYSVCCCMLFVVFCSLFVVCCSFCVVGCALFRLFISCFLYVYYLFFSFHFPRVDVYGLIVVVWCCLVFGVWSVCGWCLVFGGW